MYTSIKHNQVPQSCTIISTTSFTIKLTVDSYNFLCQVGCFSGLAVHPSRRCVALQERFVSEGEPNSSNWDPKLSDTYLFGAHRLAGCKLIKDCVMRNCNVRIYCCWLWLSCITVL